MATFSQAGGPTFAEPESAVKVEREPASDGDARVQIEPEVGQIPRNLWTTSIEERVLRFLQHEFNLAEGERADKMRQIARWRIVYAAPAADAPKRWPIWNASNLTIPVVQEMVNTLGAQIVMQTLTARPRYDLKELASEWEPFMDELERFLDISSDRDLKLDDAAIPAILECAKMGTAVLSVEHVVDVRNLYQYSSDGKKVYKKPKTYHDGPRAYHIPLTRCWIRAHQKDIQSARWFATEHDFSWEQIEQNAAQKKFGNLKALKRAAYNKTRNEAERTEEELEAFVPQSTESFQLFKVYLSWDIDKDGHYEEVVLWYSRDANCIISKKFFHYWHGMRPFAKLGYFPRENSFYDIGLCEMLEDLQNGISDKHNKRADNAALANLKMILKRKMVQGLMPGDPLYMGKVIEVNDIWNDIREWQLAEIYPSTVAEEQIMRQYAERLAGSNEATAGSAMPVTRTTAAAQLALLQEQAKRIDLTVRSVRSGLNLLGQLTTGVYHQFGTNGKAIAWMGESGRIVEAIFRLPRRVQELGLALRAAVPTSIQNRQVKAEHAVQKLNLITSVYEKLWPFAQQLAPDHMAEVARGFVHSARRFMEDLLETDDTTDIDDILAGLVVLEKVLPASEDMGGLQSFLSRAQSDAQLDRLTRVENLLLEAEATRGGHEAVSNGRGNGRGVEGAQRLPPRGGPGFSLGGPPE